MSKSALVVLGDQLFPIEYARRSKTKHVFMAEDLGLCTSPKFHKIKIAFFLSAMRHYRDELKSAGFQVNYVSMADPGFKKSYFEKLKKFARQQKLTTLKTYPIVDRAFAKQFQEFARREELELEFLESPFFLTPSDELRAYFEGKKRPFMKTFYEDQRKRTGYLMTKQGRPQGGKFSFDEANRKCLPKGHKVADPKFPKLDEITETVIMEVNSRFPDHPGSLDQFWLPVDRKGALAWLRQFFEKRFQVFGPYEDAISLESDFIYHSALSPLINSGLLTPREVVDKAIDAAKKNEVPMESLEGFVRQVIGWREFIYGIDLYFGARQAKSNFFSHTAKLKYCWYDGNTGIPPLDDAIDRVNRLGYNHHIERLMIIGNLMLLCRVAPKEVYRWFMEMYVDSAEWVMGPNVYGMSQFSDGGIFATKPYICGSNYLLKMSHYKKGHWCDIVDGLYWSFIADNISFFKKQPRLMMMVRSLEKMDQSRKEHIFKAAKNFRKRVTFAR